MTSTFYELQFKVNGEWKFDEDPDETLVDAVARFDFEKECKDFDEDVTEIRIVEVTLKSSYRVLKNANLQHCL